MIIKHQLVINDIQSTTLVHDCPPAMIPIFKPVLHQCLHVTEDKLELNVNYHTDKISLELYFSFTK